MRTVVLADNEARGGGQTVILLSVVMTVREKNRFVSQRTWFDQTHNNAFIVFAFVHCAYQRPTAATIFVQGTIFIAHVLDSNSSPPRYWPRYQR